MSDDQTIEERFIAFYQANSRSLFLRAVSQSSGDRHQAEDWLHDAFLYLWKKLESERCEQWYAQFCRFFVRRRIDLHRKRTQQRSEKVICLAGDLSQNPSNNAVDQAVSETPASSPFAKGGKFDEAVREASNQIKNPDVRRVMELLLDGISLQEIAETTKTKYATVRQHVSRGKVALRQIPAIQRLIKNPHLPTE